MVNEKRSAAEASTSGSDEVHVDLNNSEKTGAGASSSDAQEQDVDIQEAGALLKPVAKERAVKIEWRGVNVYVPIFKPKKNVFRDPTQLVPSCLKPSDDHAQRQVLFHAQGAATPGTFMALMGPSGSGKTTLVSVIGGRASNAMTTEGDILFNGEPLSRKIKRDIGFVLQDDLLFDSLTVHETLLYAARLRLPRTIPLAEKKERVDSVISALGLNKVRGTLVGGAMRRGVSGGERKRVSVAHELLIDPAVLILDEPTSGLDSTTAMNLVVALRGLASGGRTLITTIHQPSSRLYQQLDQLILMSEGHLMYSGKGSEAARWFGHLGCQLPYGVNVADFVLDLASGVFEHETVLGATGADRQQRLIGAMDDFLEKCEDGFQGPEDLHHVDHIEVDPKQQAPPPEGDVPKSAQRHIFESAPDAKAKKRAAHDKPKRLGANYFEQLQVLCVRSARTRRFEALGYLKFVQFIAVSIVAGLLWFQRAQGDTILSATDTAAACFFELLFISFGLLFASLFVFPSEISMLLKERTSDMYRLSAYYIARSAASLPLDLAYPTMFVIIMYWLSGLRQHAGWFIANWLSVLLVGLVGQSIGYIFGAGFGSLQQAQTAATVSMLTFVLCSGFWIKGVPSWLEWVKYLSFIYWGYDLVLKYQFDGVTYTVCGPANDSGSSSGSSSSSSSSDAQSGQCRKISGSELSDELALPRDITETKWLDVGVLLAMLFALRYAVYLVLKYKTRNT